MPHKHITGKGATQKKGRGKNTTEHQLSKLSWLNETKWERCNSVKERERLALISKRNGSFPKLTDTLLS